MKKLFTDNCPAILALEDGTVLKGYSIGIEGTSVGEIVFNTAMSGYQETLTDPSYKSQFILFTSSHIGNVGINDIDNESNKIWAAGVIMREYSTLYSNWRANKSLESFLQEQKVIAIAGIDTRHLTKLIREKGALKSCIMTNEYNKEKALREAREFSGLLGKDLAKQVTCLSSYKWNETIKNNYKYHIIVYDFGVKNSILVTLHNIGCKITVVPKDTSANKIIAVKPDGIFLSNGPGDPQGCNHTIQNIKRLTEANIPIFGVCFGYQLLALAFGAKTYKMKFGHHGINHPVLDVKSRKTFITSQNHSFAVNINTLPYDLKTTHISLFDQTLQGFKHRNKPIIGFQGHPEAGPGTSDMKYLFDNFIEIIHYNGRI